MEREVGGGIGMGNTCKPMAVSFQCMTKFTTKKKKKKVLITRKKKNKTLFENISIKKFEYLYLSPAPNKKSMELPVVRFQSSLVNRFREATFPRHFKSFP